MTGERMLQVRGLSGGYGDIGIVKDISLELNAGQVICITGRNGVGKTTFVRLVTGSLTPSGGQVIFSGQDLTHIPGHKRRAIGMGYAPQEHVVFDDLTVAENLTLHYRDRSLARYEALFARFPRIRERLNQQAGTLSGGERKILSICRALAEDTDLVILDEPTEGVQPENIEHMVTAIGDAKQSGRSFLIVEQNMTLIEAVADSAMLIDHGEHIFSTSDQSNMRAELSRRVQI